MAGLIYDERFYSSQSEPSSRSASAVVPLLIDLIRPKSVVDVGCGVGTWLRAFRGNGVADILGIDGAYVDRNRLQIPEDCFLSVDLPNPPLIDQRFDLALCLEVAEHIRESYASRLIDFITALAPVVCFSAAVPGQGGAGHVNEQWPDYWSRHFADRGYQIFDVIRPRIWSITQVEPWYCQNSFLYIHESQSGKYPEVMKNSCSTDLPLCLVHPELFRRFASLEYVQSKQMVFELGKRLRKRIFRRRS